MANSMAFLERKQENGDRHAFQQLINQYQVPLYHTRESAEASLPKVLFYHGNDVHMLPSKEQLQHVWLIEFGGYPTDKQLGDDRTIKYIRYSDLQDRFPEIIGKISNLREITKEALEDILFDIDPKLEGYLEPFASFSPFALLSEIVKFEEKNITVEQAKEQLQTHVNKFLSR